MRILTIVTTLLLSFAALGADSKWSYKTSANAKGGFDIAFFKDGKDFPLDQANWPEVSVAMMSYAAFLTPDQTKDFNQRIDGTLKQLDAFGWQSVVQITSDGKPRAALFHSPKESELRTAGDFIVAALANVDADRLKQIGDQKAKCVAAQNGDAGLLYDILGNLAAMSGCQVKRFSKGGKNNGKCVIDLTAPAGDLEFESRSGQKFKIIYAAPATARATIGALQAQGFCKINSQNYSSSY